MSAEVAPAPLRGTRAPLTLCRLLLLSGPGLQMRRPSLDSWGLTVPTAPSGTGLPGTGWAYVWQLCTREAEAVGCGLALPKSIPDCGSWETCLQGCVVVAA